jgi:hypothetical protein
MISEKSKTKPAGMAAILTVVVISVVGLILAKSVSFLGLGDLELAVTADKAGEVLALAEGCAEETVRRIELDPAYGASGEEFFIGEGVCAVTAASTGENKWTIESTGRLYDFYKKIRINLSIESGLTSVTGWEEF